MGGSWSCVQNVTPFLFMNNIQPVCVDITAESCFSSAIPLSRFQIKFHAFCIFCIDRAMCLFVLFCVMPVRNLKQHLRLHEHRIARAVRISRVALPWAKPSCTVWQWNNTRWRFRVHFIVPGTTVVFVVYLCLGGFPLFRPLSHFFVRWLWHLWDKHVLILKKY